MDFHFTMHRVNYGVRVERDPLKEDKSPVKKHFVLFFGSMGQETQLERDGEVIMHDM